MESPLATILALVALALVVSGCGDDPVSAPPSPDEADAMSSPMPPFASVTRFPAPVLPTASPSPGAASLIPEGFLYTEEVSRQPLNQPGVEWVRNDAPDLPPFLAPCGEPLPARGADVVAARQLVLVNRSHLWKAERLVVYRDTAAAARVLAALREALVRCARHEEGDGRHTEWQVQPLDIGDDAFYVGGQLYAGGTPLSFHYRGVVFRQGRAVHFLLVHGESTVPPTLQDVEPATVSINMAAALAAAEWAR